MPFLQNRLNCTENSALAADSVSVAKNQTTNQEAEPTKYLWIRAPKAIVYNSNFSDGAKLLYLILLDYQGRNAYAFPSLERLADDTGKSVRRVQQLLKELEAGEAIEIVSQPGWVNLYKVGLPTAISTESDTTENISDSKFKLNSQITESLSTASNSFSKDDVTQAITPVQKITPLPMQKTSPELDSTKLDSKTVCKKSPVAQSRTRIVSNAQISNGESLTKIFSQKTGIVSTQTASSFTKPNLQPARTDEQNQISTLLQLAGVATVDVLRIAATNPKLENVQQWIDFAKNKANPGGYLAVVLSKSDAVPPTLQAENATVSGQRNSKKNWRDNKRSKNNQESGAVAYIQRHQNELVKWQSDQTTDNLGVAVVDTEKAYKTSESKNSGTSQQVLQITEPQLENCEEEISPADLVFERQIKAIVRQIDREACQYLRQIRFDGDRLLVSFVGNYQPKQSVASWLPLLKTQFTAIREILLL